MNEATKEDVEAGPHLVAIFKEPTEYDGERTKRVPLRSHSHRNGEFAFVFADGTEHVIDEADVEDVIPTKAA